MVVRNNKSRKEKRLWTEQSGGDPVIGVELENEREEGRWVVNQIEALESQGFAWRDISIFYRTNAQSRMIEDSLREADISYTIVGNVGFYERKEVKDM